MFAELLKTLFKCCLFITGHAQTCAPSCDLDEWGGFEDVDDMRLNGEWIASCDIELNITTGKDHGMLYDDKFNLMRKSSQVT